MSKRESETSRRWRRRPRGCCSTLRGGVRARPRCAPFAVPCATKSRASSCTTSSCEVEGVLATMTPPGLCATFSRSSNCGIRLWQVRPPPSPALLLRPACLRRFYCTDGHAPHSYFQLLILSRPTQTCFSVCGVSRHARASLARARAHAQTKH